MVPVKHTRKSRRVEHKGPAGGAGGTAPSRPSSLGRGGGGAEMGTDAGTELSTSSRDVTEASPGESHILKKLP